MAKEKKIVDITDEEVKSEERYGRDGAGKIIKLEDPGDPKPRATKYRVGAVLLWLVAIAFEVIGILRLNGTINWFPSLSLTAFLIIVILLDLAAFIPGSLFWKKANHIDPASEKDPVKFWMINNLGTILSVLAFLPIIIFVLLNKDLDNKSKGIVTAVAAIALLIAGLSSYDFNPVSSEQLARAEAEVEAMGNFNTNDAGVPVVYWAPNSKKYHVDPDCPAFSRSEEVIQGTVRQAFEKGLTDPCRRCIHALDDDHDHDHEDEE